jgi:hypothetical protein
LDGPNGDPTGEKWNALPRREERGETRERLELEVDLLNKDHTAVAALACELKVENRRLRADLFAKSQEAPANDEAKLMQAALRIYQIQAETVGTTERKFTEAHSMSAYSVAVAISMLDAIRARKKGGE